jgi:hypothetical protein
MVTLWNEQVDTLVAERWIRGNPQPFTRNDVVGSRRSVELLIRGIEWRDPTTATSGTYEARHLFLSLGPTVTADLSVTALWIPNEAASVSELQRLTQDRLEDLPRERQKSAGRSRFTRYVRPSESRRFAAS